MIKSLSSDIKKIIGLFIAWRAFTFLIALIAPIIIPKFGAKFPYYQETLISTGLPHFIWSQANFDGVHYLRIAQDGYVYQYTQAFFPFYPILIKLGSLLTFGSELLAALLISNSAFLVGLIIFFKLVKKNFGEKIAFWASIFLVAFPTSFYFGAVYTEGIFFLLVISSFYLFEKGKVIQASIVGLFASATRLIGAFLAPALFFNKSKKSIIPLLLVPFGLFFYMLYLKIEFNNPIYFLTAQSVWGQERSTAELVLLPQVFWRYFKILTTTNGLVFVNAAFELIMTLLVFILLVLATKKVKREWLIFSWLSILTPTLTGTFTSMPRYVLIAFPIYISLALIKNTKIKVLILTVSAMVLAVATIFFSQGYWVA